MFLNNGDVSRVSELFWVASDETKKVVFENLTWEIRVQNGAALGLAMVELLILVNRDMTIAIDRRRMKLRRLFHVPTNKELVSISKMSLDRDLINLTLLTPDHQEIDVTGVIEGEQMYQWR